MSIIKLIFIILALTLLWLSIKVFLRARAFLSAIQQPPKNSKPDTLELYKCDYCNMFVPKSQVILVRNKTFCCPEHAYHA